MSNRGATKQLIAELNRNGDGDSEPSEDVRAAEAAKANADPRYIGIWTRSGSEFDIYSPAVGVKLEPATYVVRAAPMRGLYLDMLADLPVPPRIYGINHANRIMASYLARAETGTSTGVWLNGEKGSGKTMLAAVLSQEGRKLGLPTVLVQSSFTGPAFNALVEHLGQAVMIFDEFEKVYSKDDDKDGLLTMFAGSVVAKHLYIITTNSDWKVADAMRNRPGRMRYFINYKGVPGDVVADYVDERLKDKSVAKDLIKALEHIPECNFDILMATVEEHNRFGGSIADLLAIMNVTRDIDSQYKVVFVGTDPTNESKDTIEATGSWRGSLDEIMIGGNDVDGGLIAFDVRYRGKDGRWSQFYARAPAIEELEFDDTGSVVIRCETGVLRMKRPYGFSKYRQRF